MQRKVTAMGCAAILALVSACARPAPEPVTSEPIYDKYGTATACVGSDGQTYPVDPQYSNDPTRNPCDRPPECEDGYIPGTAQNQCLPPPTTDDDNPDDGLPDPQ